MSLISLETQVLVENWKRAKHSQQENDHIDTSESFNYDIEGKTDTCND